MFEMIFKPSYNFKKNTPIRFLVAPFLNNFLLFFLMLKENKNEN